MSNVTRAIYVPGVDKWVSLGDYVRQIKIAKAHPNAEFKHGLTCWWPCTGAEIMRQFRRGMHDRINQRIPYSQRGISQNKKGVNQNVSSSKQNEGRLLSHP